MRRFIFTLLGCLLMIASVASAGTFPLTDGTKIVGTPDTIAEKGVIFMLEGGDYSPRVEWDRFTPEALKELIAEAKTDSQKALLMPMVDSLPEEVAKRKEIVVKPIQTPDLPRQGTGIVGLMGSSVGWFILLVLYGANLFAAYEVSIYRRQPLGMVVGLAAIPFLGVLSPMIYGAMPTQRPPPEAMAEAPLPDGTAAPAAAGGDPAAHAAEAGTPSETHAPAAPEAPAAPALPDPIVFSRGEFSFNRRFFETKFAGFFRLVPSEAEKDLVLMITCTRGQFVGRRIVRITPNELYLQVFKNDVSADEMIPFTEVSEVQIRHKDSL